MKGYYFLLFGATTVMLTTLISASRGVPVGGQEDITDTLTREEYAMIGRAQHEINRKHLAAGEDAREREIVGVLSATRQVVQGLLYRYTLRLKIKPDEGYEECDLSTWSRPFLAEPAMQEIVTYDREKCRLVD